MFIRRDLDECLQIQQEHKQVMRKGMHSKGTLLFSEESIHGLIHRHRKDSLQGPTTLETMKNSFDHEILNDG